LKNKVCYWILFFISISSILSVDKAIPHLSLKKDVYGRNYLQKWNGDIVWNLDDSYFSSNVHSEQLPIHLQEAIELEKSKNFKEAIRLYESIIYCSKLKKTTYISSVQEEATKRLGVLYSRNSEKNFELSSLFDPVACDFQKDEIRVTYLISKELSLELQIPSDFQFVIPTKKEYLSGKTRSIIWKTRMFYRLVSQKEPETMESVLDTLSQKKSDFYFRYNRIYIFYATYPLDLPQESLVLQSWDRSRGLTPQLKRRIEFIRETKNGYLFATYTLLDPDGVTTKYGEFSYIHTHENKSISIFYNFPIAELDFAKKKWEAIWKSIKILK
jgi:hypothetical protein